ncbi:MAG: DUF1553 domain-containing protein [Ginsengibacter sp.]
MSKKLFITTLVIIAMVVCYVVWAIPGRRIDFSADVKPILNKKCITCHGGVKKQAGFSVLFREDMFAPTKSGKRAVVPGDPAASEMIRRITLTDPEERMPYKHPALSNKEIGILKDWIRQGAVWGEHWAYNPVKKQEVPAVKSEWARNEVDQYVYKKLEENDLAPSPEADKATLLRRVSLDLAGTLPSEAVTTQFLKNNNANAYPGLVDSLLQSPRFGEKWASMWLDLARYADTKGYEADNGRNIWQYRDWVIRAFNEDMPYDRFITTQIAGDLLPDPTDAQYIATGFQRNSMTNDEGGTDNEEFRTAAVLDRVNTTWTSLLSTSFGCVQCHSHPYDPIRHDEYYQFMAYFNNTRDEDVPAEYPLLRLFNDTVQRKVDSVLSWVSRYGSKHEVADTKLFLKAWQPSIYAELAKPIKNAVIGNKNWSLFFQNYGVAMLKHVDLENAGQLICNFSTNKSGGTLQFRLDSENGPVFCEWNPKKGNWKKEFVSFQPQHGIHDVYITYENPALKNKDDFVVFFDFFAFLPQLPGRENSGYAAITKLYEEVLNSDVPSTPVLLENPEWMHRASYVFKRGAWTSKGKQVEPGVPKEFSFAMPANAPRNRLGLAMWLTDKRNPLVSRTIVNRVWEQLFGKGIVETLEDMGTQGEAPTHRELLDQLSWKLMYEYNWSLKKLIREIVLSATYRQDSRISEELRQKDPDNKFYSRSSRIRLTAEQIRDQALAISGVMSTKMYGPGVMPWQPEGIWFSPYNSARWKNSRDEDQYRRAIYTYWKRTAPYPSAITFDGPQRVVCSARRITTNTPLQALAALNDSAYLDLSKHFAIRMQKEVGNNVLSQISRGYEIMLFHPIPPKVLMIFNHLYTKSLTLYKSEPKKIKEMTGDSAEYENAETAALMVVANAMLNLDEVITKN